MSAAGAWSSRPAGPTGPGWPRRRRRRRRLVVRPGLGGLAREPAGQPGPANRLGLMGLAQPARNLKAVWGMSEPKAATRSGPRISSRASRRCMQALRRRTSPDRSSTARLSGSPGPLVVSGGGHLDATAAAEPAARRPAGRSWGGWRKRRADPPTARPGPAPPSPRGAGTTRPAAARRCGSVPAPPTPRWCRWAAWAQRAWRSSARVQNR